MKYDTVKSGWSIVYIEGLQVIISKKYQTSFSEDCIFLNSTDPDEMPNNVAFHKGFHCLP